MARWNVAVEGDSDLPVVERILSDFGHEVSAVYGLQGKGALDQRVAAWCAAGRRAPWLVLRDLDREPCAPRLLARIAPGSSGMVRIAVRAVEAWLLADRERTAEWLGVARSKIPMDVEALDDPKATLLQLARVSRRRAIREDMVPRSRASIGPGYVLQVREFCRTSWRPDVAAAGSSSLRRCLAFVRRRGAGPLAP